MCAPAAAEDIDIFAPQSIGTAADPNLLIILDNSPNWDQPFGNTTRAAAITRALAVAIGALTEQTGHLNVGLMLFNQPDGVQGAGGSPTGAHQGAYVRSAIRTMTNAGNRAGLVAVLNGLRNAADSGAAAYNTLALEEARRYFGGLPVLNGNNTAEKLDGESVDSARTNYASPVTTLACQRNFVLFISNGPPAAADAIGGVPFATALNDGTLPAALALSAPPPMPVLPATQVAASNWMDELAALMREAPFPAAESGTANPAVASIQTYGIALHEPLYVPDNQSDAASGRALVVSAALHGGGSYRDAIDEQSLTVAIASILAEVQAVNTTFGSPSLPSAITPPGTYLNQVYMGLFEADGHGSPRWSGNVKQYALSYDSATGSLELVDAQGEPVISAATGFMTPMARSIWSTARTTGPILPAGSATVDFFSNAPDGSGLTPLQQAQEAPDGEVVGKGGVAQQVRAAYLGNQTARNLYTCPPAGCTTGAALAALDTATVQCVSHAVLFGVQPAECSFELPLLVAWLRGADNTIPNNEAMPGPGGIGPSPIRPSVHGDVLHSKPVLLDYGAAGIVAFYGANDGTLRAVRAGQPVAGGGRELWAFVAPETFPKFRRLREGMPLLQMPSPSSGLAIASPANGTKPKDYFFDGPISHYAVRDASGNVTRAYLFAAARRGGAFIYAFDVTVPASPKFLWKHAAHDGSDPAFDDLALTFSGPKTAIVGGHAGPVVIFGGGYAGGYDAAGAPLAEDAEPPATCAGTALQGCGNRVFVVDAATGVLIKSFQSAANGQAMTRGVAADLALVDSQATGITDRAYAVDTGGGVWRIDFDGRGIGEWNMYKVAAGDPAATRKFLQTPDVVVNQRYTAILFGSGDREKPLAGGGLDRFYMIKDKETNSTVAAGNGIVLASWPIAADSTAGNSMADVAAISVQQAAATLADPANNGWFRALAQGEKVVNAPLTAAGIVYFSTNTPAPAALACGSPLGVARTYGLQFTNGQAGRDLNGDGVRDGPDLAVTLIGGGLPPSPVGGLVSVLDAATNKMVTVPFVIGAGGVAGGQPGLAAATAPAKIQVNLSKKRRKTYWYSQPSQ